MITRHLLSIENLTSKQVFGLIERARQLKQGESPRSVKKNSACALVSLFYENSTRTTLSFALAAHRLGLFHTPLSVSQTSIQKGESLLDTLQTLSAMGVGGVIIRHPIGHVFGSFISDVPENLRLINAGDGQNEHPTQALLDMMTICENMSDLQSLKIAIVGDIRHSRVAHSFQKLCLLLGIHGLTLIAPSAWMPEKVICGQLKEDLASGLRDADIVMALRVQRERLEKDEQLCLKTYHERYGLTSKALAYAKSTALVFHPGPMNRWIEINDEVADGAQSRILQQVENGVWMRMAILESMLSGD